MTWEQAAQIVAWIFWSAVTSQIIRLARRDWHDPGEDRRVVATTASVFAVVLLAIAGLLAWWTL